MAEPIDPFHAHLDACKQCRDRPFDLCAVGILALEKAGGELAEQLKEMFPVPRPKGCFYCGRIEGHAPTCTDAEREAQRSLNRIQKLRRGE